MSNHTFYAAWPICCDRCKAVTTANFRSLPLECEECRSTKVLAFDDPTLWKGDGIPSVGWDELELTDGHYRCPKCGKYELRFGTGLPGIRWD
jgi:Zn finger protein HypA/HybF involved in hydrogenase expression